jgi:hypothetical protein
MVATHCTGVGTAQSTQGISKGPRSAGAYGYFSGRRRSGSPEEAKFGGEAITTPPRAALVLCLLLFSREPHDSLHLALGRRTSYIVVSRIC